MRLVDNLGGEVELDEVGYESGERSTLPPAGVVCVSVVLPSCLSFAN